MSLSTLNELKLQYKSDAGNIERLYDPVDPKRLLAFYHVQVKHLFYGYQTFLQARELKNEKLDDDKFCDFFEERLEKGAPLATIVCATMHFKMKGIQEAKESQELATEIKQTCQDYHITIHEVLQFVVLEYLNDANKLGDINWLPFINILLNLGADPNYQKKFYEHANIFHQVLPQDQWIVPLNQITSTFEFTLYQATMSEKVVQLTDLFVEQQKKVQSQLMLTDHNISKIIEKSIAETKESFISTQRWISLEKSNPQRIENYFKNEENSKKLITKLAEKNDFKAIDYFRNKYQINVFEILMIPDQKWPNPSLDYIESVMKDDMKAFMRKHNDILIKRFNIIEMAKNGEFSKIDFIVEKYAINPFKTLLRFNIENRKTWGEFFTDTPIFGYLAKHFTQQLKNELEENSNEYLKLCLNNDGYSCQKKMKILCLLNLKSITREDFDKIMDFFGYQPSALDFYNSELFKKLENDHKSYMRKYLQENSRFRKELLRFGKDKVFTHFTSYYNFDLYQDYYVIPSCYGPYYQARAHHILVFIFNQNYPNAIQNKGFFNRPTSVSYNEKQVIVSSNLATLIEILKKVISDPANSAKTFVQVYQKATELNKVDCDQSEKEIYQALTNYLEDDLGLSRYVHSQFKTMPMSGAGPGNGAASANNEVEAALGAGAETDERKGFTKRV